MEGSASLPVGQNLTTRRVGSGDNEYRGNESGLSSETLKKASG